MRASRRRRARSSLVRQPGALEQAGRQQLGQGARVAAVGLGLGVGDGVQLLGAGHHDARHVGLEDTRDGERVAGRLQGDLVVGGQAGGEELELARARGDAAGRAQASALADRHLAEVAVDVDADRSHGRSPSLAWLWRSAGGRIDTDGFVLVSTPGCSRRGGHRQDRARSPRQLRPARPAFSQKAPGPVGAAYSRGSPSAKPSSTIFMTGRDVSPRRPTQPNTRRHASRSRRPWTVQHNRARTTTDGFRTEVS